METDRSMIVEDEETAPAPHAEVVVKGRNVEVVRGEACADSFYAALEAAVCKLENRLRRSKDRRKVHYGDKRPVSLAEATMVSAPEAFVQRDGDESGAADGLEFHEPGQIVRTKEHPAKPMTVDDALYEMELVGHDFFLFHDQQSDRPCVVYRRHAYDYGLIRLA
jgi:ribosome-associated translation inhibitor RaiA